MLIQPEIIYNMLRECACTHGTLGKYHTTSSYMEMELEIRLYGLLTMLNMDEHIHMWSNMES